MMREVSPRRASGSAADTEAATWRRSSSWVIVRMARGGGGIAPVVQIPESVLDLTALIVETGGSSGSRAEQMFTAPEREETRRFLARLLAGNRSG
jgi:hypothetical protein